MIYLDTCYILKCYLTEPGSPEVRELVDAADGVASSVHARVEFAAAVHRHFRENRLTAAEFTGVLDVFEADCAAGYWHWLELDHDVIQLAEATFRSLTNTVFIRAADAIHLASTWKHGFNQIHSSDEHLLQAATAFGVRGINVIP